MVDGERALSRMRPRLARSGKSRRTGEVVVRLRKRYLPLVALLGALAALVPAIASSETPSISAYNEGLYYHSWMPATATVSSGGVVKFNNPYSETNHGLKFTGGSAGATPSCSGIPLAASEPTGATSWGGECTFNKPGTYTFICTVHPTEMKGTITVNPNGSTITTPTRTTTMTPSTPGESGSETTSGSPLAGSAVQAIKLASSQHGKSVHGSVEVSQAGVGGRLEVRLLARSASLAKAEHASKVSVGRFLRSSLNAGELSFAVPLTARAKKALRRHTRLALTAQIVLTPTHGAAVTVAKSVVLHA
jgi:plastocyanin